jgi:hypothetical protein
MDPKHENLEQRVPAEYSPEVLCASWTPLAAAIAEPAAACRKLVADLATVDVDTFLASFYRSQQG